jgi:hypothetical protein
MVSGPASNNNSNSNDDHDDDPSRIAATASYQYQRVDTDTDDRREEPDHAGARRTLGNFILMSLFFSANHGSAVSVLGIASARLGSVGAHQSAILMITYAASALLGATYVVKRYGPRNTMCLGMLCYCAYVGCFFLATHDNTTFRMKELAAYLGAVIGGIGAGFLWIAQGTYFGFASQDYARKLQRPVEESTASFAGYFAFLYLSEEVALRLLSSALLEFEICSWGTIFKIYTIVAFLSTLAMPIIYDYRKTDENDNDNDTNNNNDDNVVNGGDDDHKGVFYKVTVALHLLVRDPKMKYVRPGNVTIFHFGRAFVCVCVTNAFLLCFIISSKDDRFKCCLRLYRSIFKFIYQRTSCSSRLKRSRFQVYWFIVVSGTHGSSSYESVVWTHFNPYRKRSNLNFWCTLFWRSRPSLHSATGCCKIWLGHVDCGVLPPRYGTSDV